MDGHRPRCALITGIGGLHVGLLRLARPSTADRADPCRPGHGDLGMVRRLVNPQRRLTSLGDRGPAEFETLHTAADEAA